MDKKSLTETDIRTKFITPAVLANGWDRNEQIREEVFFTAGRIMVDGNVTKRAERKKADYILYYKGSIPLAIIEAKDNNHEVGAGMQQALEYAKTLDIPFVYASNGDAFIEHDKTGKSEKLEREVPLDRFPSPSELWRKYKEWKGITEEIQGVITSDYYLGSQKTRYYQQIAINRTVEAISKGQDRILLVMATGTGKTYVASQIIYKLWKSKAKRRILFLADRNILVDQARNNDFKQFGGAMTKITNRTIDTSFEIYLALYQAVSGGEELKDVYKQFSREFFDLIIVDECHRGSAADNSAWREVLDYFDKATQIGMTATPKEDAHISNIEYFGEPVYIYSLKQGIQDGFLAPYRVIRISIDKDVEGYTPEKGSRDKYGQLLPEKTFWGDEFDRSLVIDERTELVAKKVTEFLTKTNRMDKTIVFCVDIDHAERMRRALINENKDLYQINPKYVMKITGDDEIGKKELDNFIDPSEKYPVIVTTSKLLNTGVDVQTCKLIVLDSNIQSMTEFKQIIGRGTRVREDFGKMQFTIMDFRQVTNMFSDPDFDGEPVQSADFTGGQTIEIGGVTKPPTGDDTGQGQILIPPDSEKPPRKYFINGVEVNVLNEKVQLIDKSGKIITESLRDYTKHTAKEKFKSLEGFLREWKESDKKSALSKEMMEQGILLNELREEVGKDFDDFDLVCHVAFDQKMISRKDRASKVKHNSYFDKYGEKARAVVNALLDKYADGGIGDIESMTALKVNPFPQLGTPMEIVGFFGGREEYMNTIQEIENQLYRVM